MPAFYLTMLLLLIKGILRRLKESKVQSDAMRLEIHKVMAAKPRMRLFVCWGGG